VSSLRANSRSRARALEHKLQRGRNIQTFTKRDLLRSAALAAMTAMAARSIPAAAETTADRPGFLKAKDIAEAGFIFGLPIVMN